jgi:hypothetical protein
MERGVLVERPISPQLIVVGSILRQNSTQLRFTKNDYMVDALAPGDLFDVSHGARDNFIEPAPTKTNCDLDQSTGYFSGA